MDKLEALIQNTAKKALAVHQPADTSSNKSWITKLVLGLLVVAAVLWLRYRLYLKGKDLAAARTELEHQKIDAEKQKLEAALQSDEFQRAKLKHEADKTLAAAVRKEEAIGAAEATHAEQVKKVEALRKWEDLNKLAGIQ